MALSAIDWYSWSDRLDGCICFEVGSGLLAVIRVGSASSATETEGEEREAGVWTLTRLALLVYLRF